MDQPASREAQLRETVAVMEETVRLIKEMVEALEKQIAEWKRLADPEGSQR
jgi:hypothetical protein